MQQGEKSLWRGLPLALLVIGLISIVVSYYFIDRPIVDFSYSHDLRAYHFLHYPTLIPPLLEFLAAFLAPLLTLLYLFRGLKGWRYTLWLASVTILLSGSIKNTLKYTFGRFWPETWSHHNPSWISNHAYGFHFFHSGVAYQSFPSGHATITLSVMSILWWHYPKLRLLWALLSLIECLALLLLAYHFLSDIIAGAILGTLCATAVVAVAQKHQ